MAKQVVMKEWKLMKKRIEKLIKAGKDEEALQLLKKELKKDPDDFWAALKLASYYEQPKDVESARKYYLQAGKILSKAGKQLEAAQILKSAFQNLGGEELLKELGKVGKRLIIKKKTRK